MAMAHQHSTHGRPQVVQGNFQGGQPTFVAQARPGFPEAGQRQMAPHVQATLQQHAPPGQTAQQHQGPQPPASQPNPIGNAFQVPPTINLSRSGQGRPLPEAVRRKMESVFNTDFSDVRVHVGAQAQSIGAVAFTMGSQIHFAPGQYNPNTSHGQRLLGHELTHVMQQRAGRVRNPFGNGVAVVQDPGMEAEAERMGMQAAAHQMPVEAKREQPGMAAQQKPAPTPGGRPLAPHVQAAVVQPRTAQPHAQARPLTTGVIQRRDWYEYGSANTTPHIHCYSGGDCHLKDAYGTRYNLVKGGKRSSQDEINRAFDAIRTQYPLATNAIRTAVLAKMADILRDTPK